MDGGKDCAFQVILIIMGSDAHVIFVEACGKGVLTLREDSPGKLKAQISRQPFVPMPLFFHIIALKQKITGYRLLFIFLSHLLHQGKESPPQFPEKTIQFFFRKSFFIVGKEHIIRRLPFFGPVGGEPPLHIQKLFQSRGKSGKIILFFGHAPSLHGDCRQFRKTPVFLLRNGNKLIPLPFCPEG